MAIHLRPYWPTLLPDSRKLRLPSHRGALQVDVAIVGGGLIGCTTASVLASNGVRVALVEARRLGDQASAAAPGLVAPEPAVPLATLRATYGRRAARAVWETWHRSAGQFLALLRDFNVRCDVAPADVFNYVSEREDGRELERERDLRHDMDVDGRWLTPARALSLLKTPVRGAIRVEGAAVFDPYRACLGLARAARSHGAQLFERSPVTRIRQADEGVEIVTARGTTTARIVVVATGGPTRLFHPIARRFASLVTYRVVTPPLGAALRRQLPEASAILREATCPGHTLRWTRDRRLLFAGIERLRLPDRARDHALVQHSAQLMYELSLLYPDLSGIQPDYAWDAVISASDDGLPYLGPHRHYPRHVFALGAGRSDGATAMLAAQVVLRRYLGTADKTDALFGFGR